MFTGGVSGKHGVGQINSVGSSPLHHSMMGNMVPVSDSAMHIAGMMNVKDVNVGSFVQAHRSISIWTAITRDCLMVLLTEWNAKQPSLTDCYKHTLLSQISCAQEHLKEIASCE